MTVPKDTDKLLEEFLAKWKQSASVGATLKSDTGKTFILTTNADIQGTIDEKGLNEALKNQFPPAFIGRWKDLKIDFEPVDRKELAKTIFEKRFKKDGFDKAMEYVEKKLGKENCVDLKALFDPEPHMFKSRIENDGAEKAFEYARGKFTRERYAQLRAHFDADPQSFRRRIENDGFQAAFNHAQENFAADKYGQLKEIFASSIAVETPVAVSSPLVPRRTR